MKTRKAFSIPAAAALSLLLFCSVCLAAKPAAKGAADPIKLITESLKKTASLNDYHHKFNYSELKGGKMEPMVCELWWMKPDYIKLAVLEGKNAGSVVAYNPSKNTKNVAAKQKGISIPGGVKKDSPLISGFFSSDWTSNLKDVRMAASGGAKLAGTEKINGSEAYKIEITPKAGDYDKTILWIDKKSMFAVRVDQYKKGKLFSSKTWFDIKVNPGLSATDFVP